MSGLEPFVCLTDSLEWEHRVDRQHDLVIGEQLRDLS